MVHVKAPSILFNFPYPKTLIRILRYEFTTNLLHATRHATRRQLTKLLNSCCEENPAKRPSFIDIKQQLRAVVDAYD